MLSTGRGKVEEERSIQLYDILVFSFFVMDPIIEFHRPVRFIRNKSDKSLMAGA